MTQPLTVIYIAGAGRSGSTLLDRVLGTLPGVTSLAEMYPLLKHGLVEERLCSCGKTVWNCAFWNPVLTQYFQGKNVPQAVQELLTLQGQVAHSRHYFELFFTSLRPSFQAQLSAYRDYLQTLYAAIAQQTNTQILIDSSKVPSRALVLAGIPNLQVYIIHLVRDVRAVAYAWMKKRSYGPNMTLEMRRYHPLRTLFTWMMLNTLAEGLACKLPYYRVSYETFVESPQQTLTDLIAHIEPLQGKVLPFIPGKNLIHLEAMHMISGNPMRFESGLTAIRLDEDWKDKLDRTWAQVLTNLALPMLQRYGYPLWFYK